MEVDCKKQVKWDVHANNHIIKALRGEQTLIERGRGVGGGKLYGTS